MGSGILLDVALAVDLQQPPLVPLTQLALAVDLQQPPLVPLTQLASEQPPLVPLMDAQEFPLKLLIHLDLIRLLT